VIMNSKYTTSRHHGYVYFDKNSFFNHYYRKNKSVPGKNKGVALITALLIVSLATIMAVSLMSRQYMDIRRTGNIMTSDQAYLQALTMETSAANLLAFARKELPDKFDNKEVFDQAILGLNANAMQVGENEAKVSLELMYPEALFNVNALIKEDGKPNEIQKKRYRVLLNEVLRDLDEPADVDALVASLLDWIDADEEESADGGAEDSVYESKETPYKAANRMMSSISELQLVEGYTPRILFGIPKDEKDENSEAIPGILHYVSALPERDTKLNVNLMSEPKIVQSLSIYISKEIADAIIAGQPFEDIGKFRDHEAWNDLDGFADKKGNWKDVMDVLKAPESNLEVGSTYFVAKSTASLGKSVFILNSLVYVKDDGTKLEVISRAIGTSGI